MRLIDADALKAYIDAQIGRVFIGCTVGEALKILVDEQPTVEAEPRWIPCSERLPEDFGEYLVTKKSIGWNCEEYNSTDIAYFDNDRFHKANKVLAWRPLPEPYKENEDV